MLSDCQGAAVTCDGKVPLQSQSELWHQVYATVVGRYDSQQSQLPGANVTLMLRKSNCYTNKQFDAIICNSFPAKT